MIQDQRGFGVVEMILIIVVLVALVGGGWYVWHRQHQKSSSTSTAQTTNTSKASPAKKDSEITSGPGAEWNTYTNNKVGFSVQIPKQYLSSQGAECTKSSTVNDNYGNKVDSKAHYTPTQGLVPATVIEDGEDFYVAEQYTYQLANGADDGAGHTLYSSCIKTVTTADVVHNYLQHTKGSYLLDNLPFSVVAVKDEAAILTWAKVHFKDDTITMTLKNNPAGWQDVSLSCTGAGSDPCETFNFAFKLRYFKVKHKLVYLAQGQAGHIYKPDKSGFYDPQIFDSFKLL